MGKKTLRELKFHLADSTATLALTTPIFTLLETVVMDVFGEPMTDLESVISKLAAIGVVYGGAGWVYGRGRDLSHKIFNITQKTKESIQTVHDTLYTAAYSAIMSAPIYSLSMALSSAALNESFSLKKLGIGVAGAALIGAATGFFRGYIVDSYRDLVGLEPCERITYPDLIKRQRPGVKKGLAVLLPVVTLGLHIGAYNLTPSSFVDDTREVGDRIFNRQSGSENQVFYDNLTESGLEQVTLTFREPTSTLG